jgi:ribonuclease P protein component
MLACSFISKPGTLSRVTVIVNTKVAKKAVDRNLLKRRLRSLLRTYTLPIGDLVVQTRAGSPALDFQELAQQLDQCLQPIIKTQLKR